MKFSPLRFQSALAAGGLALMPFVLMQFTFPRQGKLVGIDDLSGRYDLASVFLLAVMLASTVLHFYLIAKMSREFVQWSRTGTEMRDFLADPAINVGIFSPVVALGMTVNVVIGPVAFFFPDFSWQVPALLGYGVYPFALLFLVLCTISVAVGGTWLFRDGKSVSFNYNWLLDVFAWGMVALAGAGVTMTATGPQVTAVGSVLTLCAISIGLFIYGIKGMYLIVAQMTHGNTPTEPLKPAHFIVVPINCLFAISIYKIAAYTKASLGVDIDALAFTSVVILFALSLFWIVLCMIAFRDWFRHQFPKPDFYPAQWGLVCVLVGLEVLAIYSHVSYYPSMLFLGFSYLSIAVATAIYGFVFMKFVGIIKPAQA
jgi:uncharacterized protein with PQ loop repeat